MRDIWQIETDIGAVVRSAKKIAIENIKDGDHVLTNIHRRTGDVVAFKIVIREGKPRFETNPLNNLNPVCDFFRLTKPKAVQLESLRAEWSVAKDAEDKAAELAKRAAASANQRYVIWNRVIDFDGVPDRDGFLIEIFDGRGRMLERFIWAKMESVGEFRDINAYSTQDFEETAVKFMARMACEGENIKPVIVYCDKID